MQNEIIKKYQDSSVEKIETACQALRLSYTNARQSFIEMLFYLHETKRFRENPKFKKAIFKDYIWGMFSITEAQYYKERKAFALYPKEVEKNGIGTVVKVVSLIKTENHAKVFDTIKSIQVKRKTPVKQHEINRIIENHITKKKIKPIHPAAIRTAKSYEAEISRLKDMLLQAEALNISQAKQLVKLRTTVQKYKDMMNVPFLSLVEKNNAMAKVV